MLLAAAARAEPIADFYRGKTLRMLIGYGPGGGYDLYGRLVAEFLPRFIPGNPTIVPQNMPGGGSFVAAKYMAEVAPRDGTVFGSLAQTLALDSMTNTKAKLDVTQFRYLGRVVTNIDTGVTLPKSGIKSFEDVRQKQYMVGASGGGSTTVLFPSSLNAYGGAKLKLVRGYSGTTDIILAMERGEIDIVGAYGLPGILVSQPGWVSRGEATFLYQASLTRHRLLPNVPAFPSWRSRGGPGAARGRQHRRVRPFDPDDARRAGGPARRAARSVCRDAQGPRFPRRRRAAQDDDRSGNRRGDGRDRSRDPPAAAGRRRPDRQDDAIAQVHDTVPRDNLSSACR